MSVDDWARREVAKDAEHWPVDYEAEPGIAGNAFQRGITHAFSALLSDEAVEAAKVAAIWALNGAEQIEDTAGNFWDVAEAVEIALQAAIDAVTKEAR